MNKILILFGVSLFIFALVDTVNCDENTNDFFVKNRINYDVMSGFTHKENITIQNLGNETIELKIKTHCSQENMGICNYNWFEYDNERNSDIYISLQPYKNENITLYTNVPPTTTKIIYYITLKIDRIDNNTDKTSIITKYIQIKQTASITSSFDLIIKNVKNILKYEIQSDFSRQIPIIKKDNLLVSDIIILFIGLSTMLLCISRINWAKWLS